MALQHNRGLFALLLVSSLALLAVPALAANSASTRSSSTELFGGELGRWLQQQAIPELVTLVGKHPRFRGEQIRVVTMKDGSPTTAGNGLSHALRDRLTHRLTRVQGVQIAWQNQTARCGVPRKPPYLLGVEIDVQSRSNALITIAMVDVEEGIWVSGGYLQWRGPLTQAERRAFSQAVSAAPVGSVDSPLPATEHAQISTLLQQQIECSLRGGLEGSVEVTIANPEDELLGALAVELHDALTHSATVNAVKSVQANATSEAEWQLELRTSTDVGESVVAILSSKAARAAQLAAVYVHRSEESNTASNAAPAVNTSELTLIDGLHEVPLKPGDTCYRRSAKCLDVQFELAAPSYVFVLRTQPSGEMNLGSCTSPVKTTGTKRYRMYLRDAGAGFYALATSDRLLARRLHGQLAAGAKNCRETVRGDWLADLEVTLAQADAPVDWRAFRVPAQLRDSPGKGEVLASNSSSDREANDYSRRTQP